MKLVTAREMQTIDKKAGEEYAVPGIVLMDQASKAVADAVLEILGMPVDKKAVIFCGGGNNGGDGFGAARWLQNCGVRVRVLLIGTEPEKIGGDAACELKMLTADGGTLETVSTEDDWLMAELAAAKADVLVDALVGTGFRGELRAAQRRACRLMNDYGKKIIAVDIPTGVNADDGTSDTDAVRADATVTMAMPKLGLYLHPGCENCGTIITAGIGMPHKLLAACPSKKYRVTAEIVKELLPVRAGDAHKGDAGRVVVCAGSPGYTGAAALCAHAAVKAGAGLVSLLTPLSSRDVLAVKLTEVMVHGLLERMPGVLGGGAISDVLKRAETADVLAIGPGLGTSESTQQAVREILTKADVPMVIDADALTALAGQTELLKNMQAPKALTPHPGEMARLTGLSVEEINGGRVTVAVKYAREWNAVLVLKGAPTVTACPDGTVYLNSTGSSALATGGTGDVLTGIIAGLAAQGITLQEAAVCGVYLHGLAGTMACPDIGLAAGEIDVCLEAARRIINNA